MSYGVNVFGIDRSLPDFEIANKAIDMTVDSFQSIGIPTRLCQVGIDDSRLGEIARHIAVKEVLDKAWAPLNEKDILAILVNSL